MKAASVGVLGGGWAGLCAYESLKKRGCDCMLIDGGTRIGGSWVERHSSFGCAYSLGDAFVDDDVFWRRCTRDDLQRYVEAVFAHDLHDGHMRTGEMVVRVVNAADAVVVFTRPSTSERTHVYVFDYVVLALGNSNTYIPEDISNTLCVPYIHTKHLDAQWLIRVQPQRVAIVGVRSAGVWAKRFVDNYCPGVMIDMVHRRRALYVHPPNVPARLAAAGGAALSQVERAVPYMSHHLKTTIQRTVARGVLALQRAVCKLKTYDIASVVERVIDADSIDALRNVPVYDAERTIRNDTRFVAVHDATFESYDAVIFATGYRHAYRGVRYAHSARRARDDIEHFLRHAGATPDEEAINMRESDFLYLYRGVFDARLPRFFFLNPCAIDVPTVLPVYVQHIWHIISHGEPSPDKVKAFAHKVDKVMYNWYGSRCTDKDNANASEHVRDAFASEHVRDAFASEHLRDFKSPFVFFHENLLLSDDVAM